MHNKEDRKDQKVNDRNKQHFFFPLSLPPLSVSHTRVCRRNTLLYLHPNDPSSGPRGWALCITQRSIRARSWCLLCPIINPNQLLFLSVASLFLPHVSFIWTLPSHISCTSTAACSHTHTHTHTLACYTNQSPRHVMQKHTHILVNECTHMHRSGVALSTNLVVRWRMNWIGPEFGLCVNPSQPCCRAKPCKDQLVKCTSSWQDRGFARLMWLSITLI